MKTDHVQRQGAPVEAENRSPGDIEPRGWIATAKRTVKEIREDRVPMVAAAMAYYAFLSLFPAVIAAVGIVNLLDVGRGVVARTGESIRDSLPGGAGDVLADAFVNAQQASEGASLVAAVVGIAVALWSASSVMAALQDALDVAYDVGKRRKFVKKRVVAFVLIMATLILGGVPSPFFAFGDSTLATATGFVLTVPVVVVLFSIYYYLGPNRDSAWRWVTPGGIVGTVLWIAVSAAFGFYVANFGSYGKTYGAIAGVVVLILWLYLSALVILAGGEFNSEIEQQAEFAP